MSRHHFRLLNVFAESTFGGNPLCVFESGVGLSDELMLKLARQFNLSETVFLLPAQDTDADTDAALRIFTPTGELPFAGHPSIGSAYVVSQLSSGSGKIALSTKAGRVPLEYSDGYWTLSAPCNAEQAKTRAVDLPMDDLCRLLHLAPDDVAAEPLWVDTGSEQLLIALRSSDAVARAAPDGAFPEQWPANRLGRRNVFLFAFSGRQDERETVSARYFFKAQSGVGEDPGTGSACANLGAWLRLSGRSRSARVEVTQGVSIERPCKIMLDVLENGEIRVGGRVIEIGSGSVDI